jgi:hypothetical protein
MFCAKAGHRSKECTKRHEKNSHCCVNCKNSDDSNIRRNTHKHNASSDLCPIVVHEMLVLMSKTIGAGESKNYYLNQLKKKQEKHQSH